MPASCCILEPNTPVGIYRPADDRCEVNPTTSNSYLYKVRLFILSCLYIWCVFTSDQCFGSGFKRSFLSLGRVFYLFEHFFHSDYSCLQSYRFWVQHLDIIIVTFLFFLSTFCVFRVASTSSQTTFKRTSTLSSGQWWASPPYNYSPSYSPSASAG